MNGIVFGVGFLVVLLLLLIFFGRGAAWGFVSLAVIAAIALMVIILLTGCAYNPKTNRMEVWPDIKQFEHQETAYCGTAYTRITVQDINGACGNESANLMGCHRESGGQHYVWMRPFYTYDPLFSNYWQVLEHEEKHVCEGDWHD